MGIFLKGDLLVFGVILVLTVSIRPVASTNDFGYTECRHNKYKVKCVGSNSRIFTRENYGLAEFPTLKYNEDCVNLPGNNIEKFPDNLNTIKSIRSLDLARNRLTSLPDDLNILSELEILDLSENQIELLSKRTRFPVSLRGLMLKSNNMKSIPAGIEIPGLFVLDLSGNKFTEITFDFCVSDQLIRVDFTNNPLTGDVSWYTPILNRCRNINQVPYCLFIDNHEMTCSCPTLAPILGEQPSFCMGTTLKTMEMSCNRDSDKEYREEKLFDINATEVKTQCSQFLKSALENNSQAVLPNVQLFLGLFALAAINIFS